MVIVNPFPVRAVLDGGAFAEVFEVDGPDGPAILKIARPTPLPQAYSTRGAALAGGVQWLTGSIGRWTPECNQVIRAEASQLARAKHPALVRLLSAGDFASPERAYMLLEHIPGESWRDQLRAGKAIPLSALIELVSALAQLADAKELPYHGDIKPENVLSEPGGRVRLIDPCSEMVEVRDGQVSAMLVTEDYNPFFTDSDLPALGFTIIEAFSTIHPLRLAGPIGANPRPLGPNLVRWLDKKMALGQAYQLKRLAWMPLPTELVTDFPPELEAIALRCLGLRRWETRGLELVTPFASVSELAVALQAFGKTHS